MSMQLIQCVYKVLWSGKTYRTVQRVNSCKYILITTLIEKTTKEAQKPIIKFFFFKGEGLHNHTIAVNQTTFLPCFISCSFCDIDPKPSLTHLSCAQTLCLYKSFGKTHSFSGFPFPFCPNIMNRVLEPKSSCLVTLH